MNEVNKLNKANNFNVPNMVPTSVSISVPTNMQNNEPTWFYWLMVIGGMMMIVAFIMFVYSKLPTSWKDNIFYAISHIPVRSRYGTYRPIGGKY